MAVGICKEAGKCFVCSTDFMVGTDNVMWAPTWGAGKKCHEECYPLAADVLAGRKAAQPSNRPAKGEAKPQGIPQETPKPQAIPQGTEVKSGSARFPSICKVCGNTIPKDAPIKWAEGVAGSSRHADCFGKPDTYGKPQAIPQETKQEPTKDDGAGMALANLIAPHIVPLLKDKIAPKVDMEALDNLVQERLAKHTSKVTLEFANTGEVKDIGLAHYQMPKVMAYFQVEKHVYLYGAAGGGKSTVIEQIAKALGLRFGMISLNDMSSPTLVSGFLSVSGNLVSTPFADLWENGGVFLFDEVDAANGNFLTSLNTGLAQKYIILPDGRKVEKHKDCYIAAAGNTCGLGASETYNTRTQLDGAFRERFAFMEWHYDEKLERSIAHTKNGDSRTVDKWVDWVQALRKYAAKSAPELLVSPRASIEGVDCLRHFTLDIEDVADAVIWKGIDKDTRKRILTAVPYPTLTRTKQESKTQAA